MSGTPKTRRGRETRDRMVRAAAGIMHVRGVHSTSVDDILQASDTGKSQFYRYFEGKDDLVRAVLRAHMQLWLERMAPVRDRLDSWEGWEDWFRGILAFQTEVGFRGGCPIGSMAAEMADVDDRLRADLIECFRMKRECVERGLTAMRESGLVIESADPTELSEFVLATIQGGLLVAATEKSGVGLEHALSHTLAHLKSFSQDV